MEFIEKEIDQFKKLINKMVNIDLPKNVKKICNEEQQDELIKCGTYLIKHNKLNFGIFIPEFIERKPINYDIYLGNACNILYDDFIQNTNGLLQDDGFYKLFFDTESRVSSCSWKYCGRLDPKIYKNYNFLIRYGIKKYEPIEVRKYYPLEIIIVEEDVINGHKRSDLLPDVYTPGVFIFCDNFFIQ